MIKLETLMAVWVSAHEDALLEAGAPYPQAVDAAWGELEALVKRLREEAVKAALAAEFE